MARKTAILNYPDNLLGNYPDNYAQLFGAPTPGQARAKRKEMPFIRCANFETCRSYAVKTLADNRPGRKAALCPACLKVRNRRQGAGRRAAYAQRVKDRVIADGTGGDTQDIMGPEATPPPNHSASGAKSHSASFPAGPEKE
jgi:hypothetical protein